MNVPMVDPQLAIEADRDLLSSAVGNLLQNAFKFTHQNSSVTLRAYAAADRILIDVEDNCGGFRLAMRRKCFCPSLRATKIGLASDLGYRSLGAASRQTGELLAFVTFPKKDASSRSIFRVIHLQSFLLRHLRISVLPGFPVPNSRQERRIPQLQLGRRHPNRT